ncbi:esterase-like activity of phytase [Mangrovibacter phragmitis]|uniref:Esterase-like activity of phytase n=1 Tax=Mangrovibacter phragmitis TaxID=1691903 RepID=A0A1B7L7G8_9ENTR|nr:esterase-like activity of phytase family protein [Mangrovibacter phragmitis]OAT78312.1 esterase-like activity of phytase [Mangrovibacter phragmitis]
MGFKPLLLAGFIPFCSLAAQLQVDRYVVSFPGGERVAVSQALQHTFPNGLPPGVGSGLTFTGKQHGELTFATVTDRGPNADSPDVGEKASKIFASPNFTPFIMTIRVSGNNALASEERPIHDDKGNISGLPLPQGMVGSTNEVALNSELKTLSSDPRGLDTEGITPDGKGGFWLCDEYGPFLIHVDGEGKVLAKYGPEPAAGEQSVARGLPAIIKWRQPNRGFEGVTRLPDGKILGAVQSTLNIDGKSKNKATFTRLVVLDPATGKTAMYGYPIDTHYKKASDAKIGDVVALNNHEVLLIEQGKDKDKVMHNRIYKVDLRHATDLTPFDSQTAPEFNTPEALKKRGIKLATKTEIVDLPQLGWQQEKAEGLALIDNRTLAVTNDNDFGLTSSLAHPVDGAKKLDDYQADGKGNLTYNGQPVTSTVVLSALNPPASLSELWVIHLAKPVK